MGVEISPRFFHAHAGRHWHHLGELLRRFTRQANVNRFTFAQGAYNFGNRRIATRFHPHRANCLASAIFIVDTAVIRALGARMIVRIVTIGFSVFW